MPDEAWDSDFAMPAQVSLPQKIKPDELTTTSKKVPLFLEDPSDEEPVKKDKGKGKASSNTPGKRAAQRLPQATASSSTKAEKISTASPVVSISEYSSEEDVHLLARSKGKKQLSMSPTPATMAAFRTPSPPFENPGAEPFIISDDDELPEPNAIVAASIARSQSSQTSTTVAVGTGPSVHPSGSATQPLKRTWSEVEFQEDYSLVFQPFGDEAIEDELNPWKRQAK
ncbi:hypothetical protein BOTBODRAFT_182222 [Botryobasidium botryosum FD-172 SS1]|uniref:Uncharacterized protein n=1 Tax=Botryobasidium botryosum (strain FD-172 SS1) TaxID=930990 RepID=A0A067M1S1_BOTB1|nr:hypothetical protein BOTBODRAFT_182222 [Botryobasidium botryosum FD-172 SS1]